VLTFSLACLQRRRRFRARRRARLRDLNARVLQRCWRGHHGRSVLAKRQLAAAFIAIEWRLFWKRKYRKFAARIGWFLMFWR